MLPQADCSIRIRVAACLAAVSLVAGCGPEAIGTAATGAALKKQEIEAAQVQKDAMQQKLQDAAAQGQQREQALEQAGK